MKELGGKKTKGPVIWQILNWGCFASPSLQRVATSVNNAGLPDDPPLADVGINFSPRLAKKNPALRDFLLLRQGSNLDSSDSESDVLPITPQDNKFSAKI